MALTTMYAPQNNGPHTTLSAGINASQTDITVANAAVLPDAPNVVTIGLGEDAELLLVSAVTGNILTVTRGFNGTTAKSWDAAEWVYRAITAQDVKSLQDNITALETAKMAKAATVMASGDSLNDCTTPGMYTYSASAAAGITNAPWAEQTTVAVMYRSNASDPYNVIQVAFGVSNTLAVRQRYSATWQDWVQIGAVDASITSGGTNPVQGGAIYTALAGKAAASHNQAASTVSAGTLAGRVQANATAAATLGNTQVRNITITDTDLTAGTSTLATGAVVLVYE